MCCDSKLSLGVEAFSDRHAISDEDVLALRNDDGADELHVYEAQCRVFESVKRLAEREAVRYGVFANNKEFEDIIGTVIERVWVKGIHEGAYKVGTAGLAAYATTIAQNLLKDLFKSQRNQREIVDDGVLIGRHDLGANSLDIPHKVVDIMHIQSVVEAILGMADASDENIAAFVQKYCEGDSMAVVAAALEEKLGYEISIGSIKQRLFRTRVALGKAAQKLGYNDVTSVLDPTVV